MKIIFTATSLLFSIFWLQSANATATATATAFARQENLHRWLQQQPQQVEGDTDATIPSGSGQCVAQNEILGVANSSLGYYNGNDVKNEGIYFFFSEETRNYSSLFSCVETETETEPSSGSTVYDCDYTGMINGMEGGCELLGGQLYSLEGSATCPEQGETFIETNLPVCIGMDCPIEPIIQALTTDSVSGEPCSVLDEYTATPVELKLTTECRQDLRMLMGDDAKGIGSFEYIATQQFDERFNLSNYCTSEREGIDIIETCDFEGTFEELQPECEAMGGYLYAFLYSHTINVTSLVTGELIRTSLLEYENMPICISTNCDADVLMEDMIAPYMTFWDLSGDSYEFLNTENTTYTSEYTFVEPYRAISEVVNGDDETPSPTTVVAIVETPSPTTATDTIAEDTPSPIGTTEADTSVPTTAVLGETPASTSVDAPQPTFSRTPAPSIPTTSTNNGDAASGGKRDEFTATAAAIVLSTLLMQQACVALF